MVSAYDHAGLRAARQRIVLRALAAASRDEHDDDEGPLTLRSHAVARALESTGGLTVPHQEAKGTDER